MWIRDLRAGAALILVAAGCAPAALERPEPPPAPPEEAARIDEPLPETSARVRVTTRKKIAWGIVGWDLDIPSDDAAREVSLADAVQARARCPTTRESEWRFDGFDGQTLYFACLRAEKNPVPNKRPWGRYVASDWLRTARTDAAEQELAVATSIAPFEEATRDILVGMTEAEVAQIHGPPRGRRELGPMGAFDAEYDGFTVRFIDGRVARVDDRSAP